MAKKKILVAKIRNHDIYKFYEDDESRKYIGQVFISEDDGLKMAKDSISGIKINGENIKISMKEYDSKDIMKALKRQIDGVKIDRAERKLEKEKKAEIELAK